MVKADREGPSSRHISLVTVNATIKEGTLYPAAAPRTMKKHATAGDLVKDTERTLTDDPHKKPIGVTSSPKLNSEPECEKTKGIKSPDRHTKSSSL